MRISTLRLNIRTQSRGRTGTGVTPLVFETNASTDSAIWASKRVQRYVKILNRGQKKHNFLPAMVFLW